MRDALISVIVPIYNVEKYLSRCVESIINQTYHNLEIILVDDGSPDQCPALCDNWAKTDKRIKVIHKENGGLSDARNAGLDIATGDYISFVDSDDWILPEMIGKMISALRDENADICSCGVCYCYPDLEKARVLPGFCGNSSECFGLLYDDAKYPVSAWGKLYVGRLWETLRFPSGKLYEDAFTTYKLIDSADKIVQITEALYCYRIRDGSITASLFSHKSLDEEEAWRQNYEFIARKYPEHKKAAFTFYMLRTDAVLRSLPEDQRNEFYEDFLYLLRIEQKNFFRFLICSKATLKQRICFLLQCLKNLR